jgi:hypothetical protein
VLQALLQCGEAQDAPAMLQDVGEHRVVFCGCIGSCVRLCCWCGADFLFVAARQS